MDLKETGYESVDRIQHAPVAGSCEHSNESSGSTKGGQTRNQPSDSLLHKDSAPWSALANTILD
jgi:hypothetical protein